MQTASHNSVVLDQYTTRASAYVNSAVHAAGQDLDLIAQLLANQRGAVALDVGCGGGHLTYRLAPLVSQVVACDLAESMLAAVAEQASLRGLPNIATREAAAESLPFEVATFDVVATRFSAHHWHAFAEGIAEMARVLKPGGLALMSDVVSPGVSLLDTWLQTLELLRDPSHVRDASTAEWDAALAAAGLAIERIEHLRLRLDFATWVARMDTPEPQVTAIRMLQARAASAVKDYFEMEEDSSFTVDTALFVARKT
ncbi:MAG: class I SAM-dependent methyltransferase [Rhodocyclaceae bacterium]|uniref:class I SAM-dependent methyltransferase n=1 Tax=Thauera sp. TaxID=1905334 RepID=UPI000FC07C77|nr:class I SAM-dependent methyltransferase [Thauera sp.]MCP5225505.1 class I SAM-dependent methyltransferase [Thauera sp.]RTL24454.1 MAG: class I SAM-dependent methyltransferase [Rhodocyclaceae bacterium]